VANEDSGGGFGWFIVGALIGFVAGAYLASGPGRDQVDSLRSRTIELTGGPDELKARARAAATRARTAVTERDSQDGISAARRRRDELESAERNRSK
jgi:hypothetical protein